MFLIWNNYVIRWKVEEASNVFEIIKQYFFPYEKLMEIFFMNGYLWHENPAPIFSLVFWYDRYPHHRHQYQWIWILSFIKYIHVPFTFFKTKLQVIFFFDCWNFLTLFHIFTIILSFQIINSNHRSVSFWCHSGNVVFY